MSLSAQTISNACVRCANTFPTNIPAVGGSMDHLDNWAAFGRLQNEAFD
jgi:hypothetical protein